MSVKIRLKKMGSKKRPFFRLVVADSRFPRDGRFIEKLGYYDPMTEPAKIEIDEDLLYKWLNDGAKPTPGATDVLKTAGLLERWRLLNSGVKVSELDATIEERRAKQPKPKEKTTVKMSKKAITAAKALEAEKAKAEEEAAKKEAAPPETGSKDNDSGKLTDEAVSSEAAEGSGEDGESK